MVSLRTGSDHKRRQALWAPVYHDVLSLIDGASSEHSLVPMGDPYHGKLDTTAFTGRRYHASGKEPTWTYNAAPETMGIDYIGPAQIPVLTFNGTSDVVFSPHDSMWTPGNGTADDPFSISVWFKRNGTQLEHSGIFSKYDNNPTNWTWALKNSTSDEVIIRIVDDSGSAHRGRYGTALSEVLTHIVMTYDGRGESGVDPEPGVKIYYDGVRVDDTDVAEGGTYVAMEDISAAQLSIGATEEGSGVGSNYSKGDIAGGPCGPIYVSAELTAEQVEQLYRIQAAAMGLG